MLLLNQHRQAWAKLVGQRKRFRGTIDRFGHKHRQGQSIKKGATLVLVDVHQFHSKNQIDHVWVDFTPELAALGEHLRPHGEIEFEATVVTYTKGGKNAGHMGITFDDIGLEQLSHIKVTHEPFWPKLYDAIMDDDLITYVIKTHQNIQSGLKLGRDPWGHLGNIYIGQGFANRWAKTLSWKWNHELPTKYR